MIDLFITDISLNVYACVYFLLYVASYIVYSRKIGSFKNINATQFLILYFCIASLLSLIYLNISNGLFRDYSNLSLPPYLYLFVCFCISLVPIYKYDNTIIEQIDISEKQDTIIRKTCVLICLCTLLPFLESLLQIPAAMAKDDSLANAYDSRLDGNISDYLSFFGRKFFAIVWMLNNLIPPFLFLSIIKKYDKKIIILLGISLATIWLHAMVLGGRSKLVQNALYLLFNYFLFKGYLDEKIKTKITFYGSILFSVAVLAVAAVSISRFNTTYADTSSAMDSIWAWLGLYAGEGTLNFNCWEWEIKGSTNGYMTMSVLLSLLDGHAVTVEELWRLGDKLGIPGNNFFTYVGDIYKDFGRFGTVLFILILATLTRKMSEPKIKTINIKKLIYLSLWAKILVIGPIFYTYGAYADQQNLLVAIIYCLFLL